MADFTFPDDLRYARSHEWARPGDDDTWTIGISDYAQDALGDVTFVELPEVGQRVSAGDAFGVVESVKTFSDLYAPFAGEIVEVNGALEDAPETINSAPYGDGWIVRIKASEPVPDTLLDATDYAALVAEEG